MEKRVWFIDSNILTNWVLGGAGLLKQLCDGFCLDDKFFIIYFERYKGSINFIERILSSNPTLENDEFYVSFFTINELFSAIRDEARSIKLFKTGTPLSRWNDPNKIPELPEECLSTLYTETLASFDRLFETRKIWPIPDQLMEEGSLIEGMKYYWSNYAQILFSNRYIKTQDTTLVLTAINNGADYFVTSDENLVRDLSDFVMGEFSLSLVSPESATEILGNRD